MAIPSVSSPLTQSQAVVQAEAARPSATPQKKQTTQTDTVNISTAAKELQQQSVASPQIIAAASSGDLQAKAQLAKPDAVPATK